MLSRFDGVADRLGHRDLSRPLGTSDASDRGREQDRDLRQAAVPVLGVMAGFTGGHGDDATVGCGGALVEWPDSCCRIFPVVR